MHKRSPLITVSLLVVMALLFSAAWARQNTPANPRFGKWKLKSEAPAPQSNTMTYAPYNGKGMKITIDQVNAQGAASQWGYTTMFDGKDEKLTGNPGVDTGSVRPLSDRVNEIVYKKDGKIAQILYNALSPDGKTIGVMYMRMNPEGKVTGITVATYEKMQ